MNNTADHHPIVDGVVWHRGVSRDCAHHLVAGAGVLLKQPTENCRADGKCVDLFIIFKLCKMIAIS